MILDNIEDLHTLFASAPMEVETMKHVLSGMLSIMIMSSAAMSQPTTGAGSLVPFHDKGGNHRHSDALNTTRTVGQAHTQKRAIETLEKKRPGVAQKIPQPVRRALKGKGWGALLGVEQAHAPSH